MNKSELLNDLKKNVILGHIDASDEGYDGDMEGQPGVLEQTEQGLSDGIAATEILDALSAGMEIVGERFESGEYLVPDMLASAECVGAAMSTLEPHLAKSGVESKGKFLIATVEGDLHDIGKNIVSTMVRGAGYSVKDIGINVPAEKIAAGVEEFGAEYVGLSALLTTTMSNMQGVIDTLRSKGLRDKVKILVGGAPTSPAFAEQIGADAHCKDAFEAVEIMNRYATKAA